VSKVTNFNSALQDQRGQTSGAAVLALAHNHQQLQEIMAMARAAGVQLTLPAATAPSFDTFVLAPAASQTNTITVVANSPGNATSITSVAIQDNSGDTLAVTLTAGALLIKLANATDANNTLTLIKAAIDAAMTSTTGAAASCFITGTASTQMVHGGTNTRTAVAAGGAVGGGLKSSTAGVLASRTFAIATM